FELVFHPLCSGIMPENDLYIPAGGQHTFAIQEQEYHSALDRIERVFAPQVAALGGEFILNRLWENGTVNASAQRIGNNYIVNMYGGMARHPLINNDAFLIVACHEVGHHLGGAPKASAFFANWASNEGQSDYFSGLKCFRQI